MRRRTAIAIGCGLAGGVAACSALLGIDERTLRQTDAGLEATVEASAPCDAGFCACQKHDFCEDFDSYKNVAELKPRWKAPGLPASPAEFNGTAALDPTTLIPPSPPNAFLVRTDAKNQGALATAFIQVDGRPLHQKPIVGVKLTFRVRVDLLQPADGGGTIKDSGIAEAIGLVELISGSGSNGVGVLLTESGGFVGYALHVNDIANATLAQGVPFSNDRLVSPQPYFFAFEIDIVPRTSPLVGNVPCVAGPIINLGDADPDAASGPNPLVIVLKPPLGIGGKVCEILGGELLDSSWVLDPILAVGSVQVGPGSFQAAFDDVTLDFVEE